jgi:hypothetical protein
MDINGLTRYVHSASEAERSALLCKLLGWFSTQPEAEFWVAVEQLTMLERAVPDWIAEDPATGHCQ